MHFSSSRRLAARLGTALLAAPLLMLAHPATAQTYPDRPIRLVVPYTAGQGADISARTVADALARLLGQPIVIDNKPGAGGNIGAALVARAAPDGYTLLWGSNATNAVNGWLYKNLPFDAQKDFAPISLMTQVPMVISVQPQSRHDSLKALLVDAKASPGKIGVAIPSTTSRVVFAEVQRLAGVELLPVAYKSSPGAMNDLLGGHVPVTIDTLTASLPLIRAGKLKPLAVTLARRSPALPQVPTVAEQGLAGFDLGPWNVVAAPRGTPPAIVSLLNARIRETMALPETRQKFRDSSGLEPGPEPTLSPADVQAFIARETETWGRIIRDANITAD